MEPLKPLTKETVIKKTSDEELFALFHTFKEHYNKLCDSGEIDDFFGFKPLDQEIYFTIKSLKETYGDEA